MTSPKWQRARVVKNTDPAMIGKTLWVECRAPETGPLFVPNTDRYVGDRPHFDAHIIDSAGRQVAAPVEMVELLPDFADDVPLVEYDEWYRADD